MSGDGNGHSDDSPKADLSGWIGVLYAEGTKTSSPPRSFGYDHYALSAVGGKDRPRFLVAAASDDELALLDLPTEHLTPLGPLPGNFELSTDNHGTPWAFFPNAPTHVSRLDPTSGAQTEVIAVPLLGGAAKPRDWAISADSDALWIFLRRDGEPSSSVYRLDVSSKQISSVLDHTERKIVGATGV